jgi:hypothetical protein
MKLYLTPDILKAGSTLLRLNKSTPQLEYLAQRNHPIALDRPILHNGRRVSVVILTSYDLTADNKAEVDFIPIWQRTFTVYHARTNKLRLLVLETENGKLSFDGSNDGKPAPCSFTTAGDGAAGEDADLKLAKLLQEDPWPFLVGDVAKYLAGTVVLNKAAA